jgi:hypothetical protein
VLRHNALKPKLAGAMENERAVLVGMAVLDALEICDADVAAGHRR